MASAKVMACARMLADNGYKIAFVESASAGKMSYEFSTAPNSGDILLGGITCYDVSLKEDALGIPHGLIETFTAESAEVTKEMALSFCRQYPVDVCVALTGLTTPGGSETEEKPVGTIFIHAVLRGSELACRFEFKGSPEQIVDQAIDATAELLYERLKKLH